MSTPTCIPVPCRIWRISATVRVAGATVAAGAAGGAVGLGAFDPEPDMVGDVRKGDGGFSSEIDNSSSDESELIGGGGDRGCWDDTLVY